MSLADWAKNGWLRALSDSSGTTTHRSGINIKRTPTISMPVEKNAMKQSMTSRALSVKKRRKNSSIFAPN